MCIIQHGKSNSVGLDLERSFIVAIPTVVIGIGMERATTCQNRESLSYVCFKRSESISRYLSALKIKLAQFKMILLQTHANRNSTVTSNYLYFFFFWKENILYSTSTKLPQSQFFPHLTFALTDRFSKLVYKFLQHTCLLILLIDF